MARAPLSGAARQSRGFALIIVLWVLVLIAFITMHLVGSGRVELRIAGNLVANSVGQAAADGAVWRTVFELMQPDPAKRWPLDGSLHVVAIGGSRVEVRVYDEAARINPSLAQPRVLEALLTVTGSDPETARRLAAAIGAWVGSAGAALKRGALVAEYRNAGRDYAPPGEPLEQLDELRQVIGMTPQIFAAIRPHLSLFAPAEPDAAYADPVVKAVIAALAGPQAAALPLAPRLSDTLTARIVANAVGPGNARMTRLAIVRAMPGSGSYSILSWDSGRGGG